MKRTIKREWNQVKWEYFRLKSDIIRWYNKTFKKQESIKYWVVVK